MDKLIIEGGNRLIGEVEISGSKNATLPLMASALLIDDKAGLTLNGVPPLKDIETFNKLLKHMGCKVSFKDGVLKISLDEKKANPEAPYELVKTMRASILVLGPLLARFGKAKVSLPGGCAIGARPVDQHIMGLEKMGAKVTIDHGYITAECKKLKGAKICFDMPTVTGTANLMLAATLAEGKTILENAAIEPEVTDLAQALSKMGAKIGGIGTDTISIEGVKSLKALEHEVIRDRIEAGTFMIASAITKGNIVIKNCPTEHLDSLIEKLKQVGVHIEEEKEGLRVKGDLPIQSVDIKTSPYPGFPTDMQAQLMSLMCVSKGLSVIIENIFENRYMHVSELNRMGADITVDGKNAVVRGVKSLSGAEIMATDLRASASLILAGLVAEGETTISRIYHLDRGYDAIEEKLKKLGAKIKRVKETKKTKEA